jgi:chaperone BCS1
MKVILSIEQDEYLMVLKYLHFKLPPEIPRRFSNYKCTEQVFYTIAEPVFDYNNLHFEILTKPGVFKKFDNIFREYSELHIDGDLNEISDFINTALKYILKNSFNNEKLVIYRSLYTMWDENKELGSRTIDSVYLPGTIKQELVTDISLFLNESVQQRYRELHINNIRIYMFYGIPGTGKTSVIKSLANHFKKNIANLNFERECDYSSVLKLMERVPDNSFVCIEDIDSIFGEDRTNKTGLTFSDFINIFDGVQTPQNTIIFMTTNRLMELDNAVIRRIHYFIEFKHSTKEQIQELFQRFFPNSNFELFYRSVGDIPVTINIMEKFFTRYLFDDILERAKLFPKFANGELRVELNKNNLYI